MLDYPETLLIQGAHQGIQRVPRRRRIMEGRGENGQRRCARRTCRSTSAHSSKEIREQVHAQPLWSRVSATGRFSTERVSFRACSAVAVQVQAVALHRKERFVNDASCMQTSEHAGQDGSAPRQTQDFLLLRTVQVGVPPGEAASVTPLSWF